MSEYIWVRVPKIRNTDVELHGRFRITDEGDRYVEWYLTPEAAEIIINGYESDIRNYQDKIIALNTEIAQLRAQLNPKPGTFAIPTGNRYGGGYGD